MTYTASICRLCGEPFPDFNWGISQSAIDHLEECVKKKARERAERAVDSAWEQNSERGL